VPSSKAIIVLHLYEQRKTCPIRKVVVGLIRFSLQSVLTDTPRTLAIRDNVSPLFTL